MQGPGAGRDGTGALQRRDLGPVEHIRDRLTLLRSKRKERVHDHRDSTRVEKGCQIRDERLAHASCEDAKDVLAKRRTRRKAKLEVVRLRISER